MAKKVLVLFIVSIMLLSFPLSVSAAGVSNTMEFSVAYPEPTCNENQGYFSVVYWDGIGSYRLWTYFWNIQDMTEFDASVSMRITLDNNILSFKPNIFGDHYASVTLANFTYNDDLSVCYTKNLYSSDQGNIYNDSYAGVQIVGFLYGGNVTLATNLQGFDVPIVNFSNKVSAVQLNNRLDNILANLAQIEGDTSDMVFELENIYNESVDINVKLDNLQNLLNEIKLELETQTSWLEKIHDLLEDAPEKEKDTAQSAGESSKDDVNNSVEDKSGNFMGSLNDLVGAMGYSGTECSWTFPALYIPEIPGVIARTQLSPEMPIDFEFWVNKIPSNVLKLVQSLLTMALVIYCFKEFYGLISYVLTLKGGHADE